MQLNTLAQPKSGDAPVDISTVDRTKRAERDGAFGRVFGDDNSIPKGDSQAGEPSKEIIGERDEAAARPDSAVVNTAESQVNAVEPTVLVAATTPTVPITTSEEALVDPNLQNPLTAAKAPDDVGAVQSVQPKMVAESVPQLTDAGKATPTQIPPTETAGGDVAVLPEDTPIDTKAAATPVATSQREGDVKPVQKMDAPFAETKAASIATPETVEPSTPQKAAQVDEAQSVASSDAKTAVPSDVPRTSVETGNGASTSKVPEEQPARNSATDAVHQAANVTTRPTGSPDAPRRGDDDTTIDVARSDIPRDAPKDAGAPVTAAKASAVHGEFASAQPLDDQIDAPTDAEMAEVEAEAEVDAKTDGPRDRTTDTKASPNATAQAYSFATAFVSRTATDDSGASSILGAVDDVQGRFDQMSITSGRDASVAAQVTHLQRTEIPASVATQIAEAARSLPDCPVEISLSPEELGRVKLTFQVSETGAMTVVVQAEKPDTAEMMRRNIHLLQDEFASLGYQNSEFQFAGNSNGQQGADKETSGGFGGNVGAATGDVDSAAERAPIAPVKLSLDGTARVDMRL